MKKEELFKNMTDIDDDLIAASKSEGCEPIVIHTNAEGRKKSGFKPIAAAAACLALVGVGAFFAVDLFKNGVDSDPPYESSEASGQNGSDQPSQTDNATVATEDITAKYPDIPLYQYLGDYSDLEVSVITGIDFVTFYNSYRDIALDSDLVVMGEFIGDARQDVSPDDTQAYNKMVSSYNILKIETVLKGDLNERDQIVISDPYAVQGSKVTNCGTSLTPMLRGDRWVYFLRKAGDGDYYTVVNDYQGRYPVPGETTANDPPEAFIKACGEDRESMVAKYGNTYEGGKESQGIYDVLTQIFDPASVPALKKIVDRNDFIAEDGFLGDITFEMTEFPYIVFEYAAEIGSEEHGLYVSELWSSVGGRGDRMWGGAEVTVNKLYLKDLNGDGKREICAELHMDSEIDTTSVFVLDYANQKTYAAGKDVEQFNGFNNDGSPQDFLSKNEFWLAERDGKLYLLETERTSDGSMGNILNDNELALDLMHVYSDDEPDAVPSSVEVILDIETDVYGTPIEFYMPENPEFIFIFQGGNNTLNPFGMLISNTSTNETEEIWGGENYIAKIYLTDLNNDGYREICMEIRKEGEGVNDRSGIYVWDKHNNREYMLSYSNEYDYSLYYTDGVLVAAKTKVGEEEACERTTLSLNMMKKTDLFFNK